MHCNNSSTFNNCTLCPHCIYVFCIYLRTNSDLCHLQHKQIGFYNGDENCLQRGMIWGFKWSGLSFVFKGLISAGKESKLPVNCASTKYLFMCIEQSSGQNQNTKEGNECFDMRKIKIHNNDINKSIYYVWSLRQFKFRKFLLPFSSEYFVFPLVT